MATVITAFVRHLSGKMLRHYFEFRQIDCSGQVDWQLGEHKVQQQVLDFINALPAPQRTEVLIDAERIHELADEAGHRAMHDVARDRDALLAAFDAIESGYGRALWLFMHDPEAFARSGNVRHCDQLRDGRSWSGFVGPSGLALDMSPQAARRFADACNEVYRKAGGFRGQAAVDIFERLASWHDDAAGSVTQVTLYVEDRPQSVTQFEQEGLRRRPTRPACEAHLTYCAADGAIDVVAKGGKTIKTAIAGRFIRDLLGVACDPDNVPLREIDLAPLADPATLTRWLGSALARVDITSLRLKALDPKLPHITLGRSGSSEHSIYEGARHWLGTAPIDRIGVIDRAELSFEFLPEAGQRRGARVAVSLTCPNGCSVKDKGQRHRPVIEEFLERSGIYQMPKPDDDEQIEAAE